MSAPKLSLYYSDRQDDGRAYRNPFGGEDVPSVTTVLKLTNKEALVQWAANLTANFAATQTDMILTRTVQDATRGLAYHWKNFRDERAEVGTAVHEYIQADLEGEWLLPELWDKEVAQCVEQYLAFRTEHTVEPYFVETTLWSEKYGYAGTADFIGLIDGEMWSLDNKTSKSTWPEHEYQIAALENCDYALVEVPEGTPESVEYVNPKKESSWWLKTEIPKIERRGFLHLRPDYFDPIRQKFTPAFHNLVEVHPDDIAPLFHTFLGYRQAWDGIAGVKALRALRDKETSASVDNEQKEVW